MLRSQPERRVRVDQDGGSLSGCIVTELNPTSIASEDYRALRTSLLYTPIDTPPKTLVVTSPGIAEGKSTVCANLGVVLAQAGKNTLILDCDFRRPMMHTVFGVAATYGITNVLTGELAPREAYQDPLPNLALKVLTVGTLPPNPAEILGSERFSEFLADVRKEFDYVLVDSSPVKVVSDSIILATKGDGVLLTVDAHKTSKRDVRQAICSLTAVGANVLGTVMNNVKANKKSDGY